MKSSMLKRQLIPIITFFVVLQSGCSTERYNSVGTTEAGDSFGYPNLDMSKTILREYKPDSGKWQVIHYQLVDLVEDTESNLPSIVSALGGDYQTDDVYYLAVEPMEEGGTHLITIPFDEVHEKTADSILNFVVYDTEELCVYTDGGRGLTYWYPKELLALAGKEYKKYAVVDFRTVGEGISTIDLDSSPQYLDNTFTVGGVSRSVRDVSEMLMGQVMDSDVPWVRPGNMTLKNDKISIIKYDNGEYGYLFHYGYVLDGVPLLESDGLNDYSIYDDIDESKYVVMKGTYANSEYVGTYSGTKADYVMISSMNSLPYTSREAGQLIDYGTACDIVSGYLSSDHVFTVDEAVLQYGYVQYRVRGEQSKEPDYYVEPLWRFTVSDLNSADRSLLYLYIEAETGDLMVQFVEAE